MLNTMRVHAKRSEGDVKRKMRLLKSFNLNGSLKIY